MSLINNDSGDGEIRTLDPLLARQVLSQLSYTPKIFAIHLGMHHLLGYFYSKILNVQIYSDKWA